MTAYEQLLERLKSEQYTWLITGVAGFIGSNLLETLLKLDQKIVGLDNFSTGYQRNLDEVQSLVSLEQWSRFRFIEGDIRNLSDCQKACVGVDYVLHEAALGSVPRSIENPIATNQTNIDGFLNMLVASRDSGVLRFVYAASSSTYGDHPDLPKIEEQIGNPLSPYAVTKLVNELYATVFSKTYSFQSIGLRYFNVFGRRQDPRGAYAAVIPKWIACIIRGMDVCVNGDGTTSRDFCYIENVCQANLLAAFFQRTEIFLEVKYSNKIYDLSIDILNSSRYRYIFNFLPNLILLRRKMIDIIEKENINIIKPIYKEFRVGDVKHSLADIKKIVELLGYEPEIRVPEGLSRTIDWYINSLKDLKNVQ